MNERLLINGEVWGFVAGLPAGFGGPFLPQAVSAFARGPWGFLCIQELATKNVFIRHVSLEAKQDILVQNTEIRPGLQCIVALNGGFQHLLQGFKKLWINEKEFCLFNRGNRGSEAFFGKGRFYSLLNACYDAGACDKVLSYFPSIQKSIQKGLSKAALYLKKPLTARFSVHDAIQAIFYDRYLPALEKTYIEMRMETALFSLLAQAEAPAKDKPASAAKHDKAAAARALMLENPLKRLTIKQIASTLHCSSSSVQKAFRKVYGTGPYEFLREQRMLLARNRLLAGESLKVVAIEMGIKPQDFPKEFKLFFGYTITDLKKGKE